MPTHYTTHNHIRTPIKHTRIKQQPHGPTHNSVTNHLYLPCSVTVVMVELEPNAALNAFKPASVTCLCSSPVCVCVCVCACVCVGVTAMNTTPDEERHTPNTHQAHYTKPNQTTPHHTTTNLCQHTTPMPTHHARHNRIHIPTKHTRMHTDTRLDS